MKDNIQVYDNYIVSDRGRKFDILKLVLSIMVVMIHTKPLPDVFMPLLRLAVPLFFIMTAYFFFLKQKNQPSKQQQLNLNKYVVRALKLYLFWFVVLLPFTIVIRHWYSMPIGEFVPYFIKKLLFGSTFKASWFLMASLLGVVLVFYLSKFLNNYVLLVIGIVLYFFGCLSTNYFGLLKSSSFMSLVYQWTTSNMGIPHNSFMVAFLWIVVGKIIAEHHLFVSNRKVILALAVSLLLLYVEYFTLKRFGLVKTNDCYVMLIPTAVLLFVLIGQNTIGIPDGVNTMKCRKMSTIIYCVHLTIASLLPQLLRFMHLPKNNVLLFLFTITISVLVGLLIIALEDRKYFKILKYSY